MSARLLLPTRMSPESSMSGMLPHDQEAGMIPNPE